MQDIRSKKKLLVDRFKSYNDNGISKVFHPADTLATVVKHINSYNPDLLRGTQYSPASIHDILCIVPSIAVFGDSRWMAITNEFCSSGKGYDLVQAYCSGVMEFIERYQVKLHLRDNYSVIDNELNLKSKDIDFIPLSNLNLFCHIGEDIKVLQTVSKEEWENFKCKWYECSDLDGNKILIPMNIVRLVFQGTNGMASGNTLEEALLHGICEAFERHCKTLVEFDKYYETKIIDQDTITSKPIRDLLFKLKMFGVKVDLRDCSLGLGIPVVASIRQVDQNDYTICYGCSPNPEEATMRAILESVQTASVPDLYINKDIVIERHFSGQVNIISFKDIPNLSNNNIKVEIEQINSILEKNDMKVYFMNCTIPGIDVPAVYVYIKNTRFNRRMFYRNYVHGDHFIVRDYVNAIKGNKLEY